MTIREAKPLIKEYYNLQNEKVNSIRKITYNSEILDENENVVGYLKDEKFLCNVTDESQKQIITLCQIGYDAYGRYYATECGSAEIGEEQMLINNWDC